MATDIMLRQTWRNYVNLIHYLRHIGYASYPGYTHCISYSDCLILQPYEEYDVGTF